MSFPLGGFDCCLHRADSKIFCSHRVASHCFDLGCQAQQSHTTLRRIMIFTLKVTLLGGMYAESECIRTLEIDSSSTLENLHLTILHAVGFDNDHLYEFYISRTEHSRDRRRFSNFEGYVEEEDENSNDTTLESLFPLDKGKNLYYLFDFGDSWRFRITKNRKKPTEPVKGVRYPQIVKSTGDDPEQYPSFDD